MDIDAFTIRLGNAFERQRKKLKLTHEAVAERADINVNYYARIERGEINTSLKKILCIADALETKPSKLFFEAEKTS